MMLPNFPSFRLGIPKFALFVLMVIIPLAIVAGYQMVKVKNSLDKRRDQMQEVESFENCTGKYATLACLDYRKAKLALDHQYKGELNELKQKRRAAEK